MKINKATLPLNEEVYMFANDNILFDMYVDNIIDLESLSKKDDIYDLNFIIIKNNIKLLKNELLKRKCKYL